MNKILDLTNQRNAEIKYLSTLLKNTDSYTETKSVEVLNDILKLNREITIEESKVIVETISKNLEDSK